MLANLPEQFWIIFTSIQSSGLDGVLQGERHDLFITRKCLISQTTCVVTLSATFYTPTSKFPIPRTADQIIPLSNLSPTQANVFSIDESGLGGVSMVTLLSFHYQLPQDHEWLTFPKWSKTYGYIIHFASLGRPLTFSITLMMPSKSSIDALRCCILGR